MYYTGESNFVAQFNLSCWSTSNTTER